MKNYNNSAIRRRLALQLTGAAVVSTITARKSVAAPVEIRVVADKGMENQTIIELLNRQDYLRSFGIQQTLVMVEKPLATLKALTENQADVCVTSAFNGILPAIARGAPVKIVGGAMQQLALAMYSARPDITSVTDLIGRKVGIGPKLGLLHMVTLALLWAKGIDPAEVNFVSVGSNLEVYRNVASGKLDSGLSDVSHMANTKASGPHILAGGKTWKELPNYPYQFAYASDRAILENRDAIVRTLAAYGKLFRFIASPVSWPAYEAARVQAGGDARSARAIWNYIQTEHPYEESPATSTKCIDYLQGIDVSLGLQKSVLPISSIADLSLAHDALNML